MENIGPPMDLENMRQNGVRMLFVTCLGCGHEADVNVDKYPKHLEVPSFANKWPCGKCGERNSTVRPAWHTKPNQLPLLGVLWKDCPKKSSLPISYVTGAAAPNKGQLDEGYV